VDGDEARQGMVGEMAPDRPSLCGEVVSSFGRSKAWMNNSDVRHSSCHLTQHHTVLWSKIVCAMNALQQVEQSLG
jgi:hypothetical protein